MERTAALTELIDDIERFGNKLILIVNIATSEQLLSERARRGLLEYGTDTIKDYNDIEKKIQNYRDSCAPS